MKQFCEFRERKNTLFSHVTPLTINPSLSIIAVFAGVSQPDVEMVLADTADKDILGLKFFRGDVEDVPHQEATLAQNHKWTDIKILPRQDKLVFETWIAIPDTDMNMKENAFGVLSIFE